MAIVDDVRIHQDFGEKSTLSIDKRRREVELPVHPQSRFKTVVFPVSIDRGKTNITPGTFKGIMAVNKLNKAANARLTAGVIESIVTMNRMFELIPFDAIEGGALSYKRIKPSGIPDDSSWYWKSS